MYEYIVNFSKLVCDTQLACSPQLCREYRSAVAFNARLGSEDGTKTVPCQELLDIILIPFTWHPATLDTRGKNFYIQYIHPSVAVTVFGRNRMMF